MTFYTNELPEDPRRRQLLLVFDRVEAERLRRTRDGGELDLAEEVAVLALTDLLPQRGQTLEAVQSAQGTLPREVRLALNPFREFAYEPVTQLVEGLPVGKAYALRALSQRLGATEFRCEVGHRATSGGEWKAGLAAGVPKAGGEVLLKRAVSRLLSEQTVVSGTYEGGPVDHAGIDTLRHRGLAYDRDMEQLVREATYVANPPRELSVEVDVETQARRVLSLAAKVRVKGIESSVDFAVESHESARHSMRIRVKWKRA